MKQVIVLFATILLGVFIVNCILGDGGIYDAMKNVWAHELAAREMQVVGP